MAKRQSIADRFWSKVNSSGGPDTCWPWTAFCLPNGYGHFWGYRYIRDNRSRSKSGGAHRWAWELTRGPIPAEMFVLHRCDNPPCCNPAHLFLGTPADNMHDMVAKGREAHVRGENHGAAILTARTVLEIRTALSSGNSQQSLAGRFGVSQTLISAINLRKVWRHI